LQQLQQDLQAGDLSAAQTDYNNIQSLAQNGPFANGGAFSNSGRQQDFTALGQALQSGDLAGAQQDFSDIRHSFHLRQPEPQSSGETITINLNGTPASPVTLSSGSVSSNNGPVQTSPTTTSTPSTTGSTSAGATADATAAGPEIVLNLGNGGAGEQITIGINNTSSGEQVTLSVANQQNQTPESFTFNFNQNSNAEIVLNLLNTTNPTSGTVGSNVSVSA